MKRSLLFAQMVLSLLFINKLFPQTDSLNIYWNANTEPDMKEYRLYRAENNSDAYTLLKVVPHPGTHVVDRSNIYPGSLYSYYLVAVDSAGNASDPSDVVSAGIPEINWTLSQIPSGQTTTVGFNEVFHDPDHAVSVLQPEVSNQNNIRVVVNDQSLELTPNPTNFIGTASFTLKVQDPDGFWDQKNIQLQVISGGTLTFQVDVPPIRFLEDQSFTLWMDTCVTIEQYNPDQLVWEFRNLKNLKAEYNQQTRRVTFRSVHPDWYGQETVTFVAVAPNQASESDQETIQVVAVNDPPQTNLKDLYISSVSNNIFDLKQYATDVDNAATELNWTFSGYSHFEITWEDKAQKLIKIRSKDGTVEEQGTFRVTDPQGASSTATVVLHYRTSSSNTPPRLVNAPKRITFEEDGKYLILLSDIVVDSTNTLNELSWEFRPGNGLRYQVNAREGKLWVLDEKDWNGESSFTIRVTDPGNLSDEVEIPVTVLPRVDLEALQIRPLNENAVKVQVAGDTPNKITFSYWISPILIHTYQSPDYRTEHEFQLNGLLADTSYYFKLTIEDTSGYVLNVEQSTFNTREGGGLPGLAPEEEIIVFPNPFRPAQGHDRVYFDNLPVEASDLYIYDVTGDLKYSVNFSGLPPRRFAWDGRTDRGQPVGSGLYIYLVRGEGNKKLKSGKIVIIR